MTHLTHLPTSRRPTGFTLIELLITVAIAAVLGSLAAPSFQTLIMRQKIKTASADLVSSLMLARSEAIKQNSNVTMASTSATNSWVNGWTVTGAGGTIKTQAAYSKLTISSGSSGPSSIVYNRSGRFTTTSATTTFQINDATSGSTVVGRCVTIGSTGQPTSKDGSC